MKATRKALLVLAALCSTLFAAAQAPPTADMLTILDTAPAIPEYIYCEISGLRNPNRKGIYVRIDFGQEHKGKSTYLITDASGRMIRFNSCVDALNYMAFRGWELVQSNTFGEEGDFVAMMLRIPTSKLTGEQRRRLTESASRIGE